MKVTLKRAHFYETAALKAATEAKYEPTTRLSIYAPALTSGSTDGVSGEFVKARTKLLNAHDLSLDLIRAVYAIRALLATANAQHGVSTRLTTNAQLNAEEGRLRALLKAFDADSRIETTPEAVLAKAEAIRTQPTDRYIGGREDSVTMAAFTDEDVAYVRKQLKRVVDERAGINDALTALNVTHTITLDEATVVTLQKAELLPV